MINYFDNAEVNVLFSEYLEVRKKNKLSNEGKALTILLNKLKPYSDEQKKEMLENAIVGNWKSVYPLKENGNTGGNVFFDILRKEGKMNE